MMSNLNEILKESNVGLKELGVVMESVKSGKRVIVCGGNCTGKSWLAALLIQTAGLSERELYLISREDVEKSKNRVCTVLCESAKETVEFLHHLGVSEEKLLDFEFVVTMARKSKLSLGGILAKKYIKSVDLMCRLLEKCEGGEQGF